MERYPGTNSASSYASEVTLIDQRENLQEEHRIYMNHILDYGGYRFFQSSYDQDEGGTVLSVNHDFWGTWISYIGYAILTLGMIFTLLGRKSRFYDLSKNLRGLRSKAKATPAYILFACLMFGATGAQANAVNEYASLAINPQHAQEFSRLTVQDHKGRMKPMHTLCSEVMRKIARKESLYDQSASQIFLGMLIYPEEWSKIPLIKIGKHEEIIKILNAGDAELMPFDAFFSQSGQYILKDMVRRSYSLEPIDRTALDKELMRLDERVNICNMIFSGALVRVFPTGSADNTWISPVDLRKLGDTGMQTLAQKFFPAYVPTVREAMTTGNWTLANELVAELATYQHRTGSDIVPSQAKLDFEILLNKSNVFDRLGKYYGLLGLAFLLIFFVSVFNHNLDMKWPLRIALGLMIACFFMHTAGLGIRWYVSGRAPWSNGYESMIYIGWTTTLAGLIFARKSLGGLTATAILASTILMVAHLSYLDPEITPLVPVLRSYWLTIHVSLEAGSYGFLMLGAIIGILNLLLITFLTERNRTRVMRTVKELSWISEMTLIGGLFMISVGTYLGGVWANESWGRYWGWDAKETWALVTILVYAFILHMRFIPGLRGFFAFNVASLFGFASVMMTYFGVNYYLSGLHSYAAGDPVPIPASVYITAASFLVLSLIALWRWKVHKGN
jgi:cytochrome c-type biogenesis protein CcsB